MALGELFVVVGAKIEGFKRAMSEVNTGIGLMNSELNEATAGARILGSQMQTVGATLTGALTVPLVGIGGAALAVAKDFETSLAKITAFGDIAGADLDRLRTQAMQLGKDTQFSAQQAADAMVVFASAGLNANQIYAAMPGTLALAAAGQLEVANAATITKDALGQFELSADQSTRVADVLAQASADASASIQEMAMTLTFAGPVFHGAGQSLEETTAAIVALDQAGIRGEKAGTGLRGVLGSLVDPSQQSAAMMEKLKVNISDASGKMLPLSDIMEQFKVGLRGLSTDTERQNAIFQVFGREAGNAAQVLIQKGGPALDDLEQRLISSGGAADRMAKTINSGLNFSMEQLKGSVETAGIALGTALIPIARSAIDTFTNFVNNAIIPAVEWFGKLPEPLQQGIVGFAGLAAAIGPILLAVGTIIGPLTTTITLFASLGPLLAVVAAGAAALAVAWAAWQVEPIRDAVIDLWGAIQSLGQSIGAVFTAMEPWLTVLGSAGEGLLRILGVLLAGGLIANLKILEEMATAIGFVFREIVAPAVGFVIEKLTTFVSWVAKVTALADAFDFLKEKTNAWVTSSGDADDKAKKLSTTLSDAVKPTKSLTDETEELKKKTIATIPKLETLGTSTKDVSDKFDDGHKSVKKFQDEILIAKIQQYSAEHNKLAKEIADLEIQLDKAKKTGFDWTEEAIRGTDKLNALGLSAADAASIKIPSLITSLGTAETQTGDLNAAFGALGIKSQTEFNKVATEAAKARDVVLGSGLATDFEKQTAVFKALEAQVAAAKAAGIAIPAEQTALLDKMKSEIDTKLGTGASASTTSIAGAWKSFGTEVSTVITNFAQDISKSLWDGDTSWGEKGKKLLTGLGEAVTSSFIQPATQALNTFITGVLNDLLTGKGFGGILDRVTSIGDSIKGIFSATGGAVSGAGGAAGGAAQAGGAVSGVAGAASGLVGALGAIGSLGSFATGIIQSFQLRGLGKDMGQVEENTRFTAIALIGKSGVVDTMREFLPGIADIHAAIYSHILPAMAETIDALRFDVVGWLNRIDDILRLHHLPVMEEIRDNLSGVNEPRVTVNVAGSVIGESDLVKIIERVMAKNLRLQGVIA